MKSCESYIIINTTLLTLPVYGCRHLGRGCRDWGQGGETVLGT